MCLVAAEWIELLDAPMCVVVHREPLSVANSMMIYSHNVSLAEWASVYEQYYQSVLKACAGKPTTVVQHSELVSNPSAAVKRLYTELVRAGVEHLTLPTEAQVAQLLRPSTEKAPLYFAAERKMVGVNAATISAALSAGTTTPLASPAKWLVKPRKSTEAFATLLTTDNIDYLRGALVLGSSIRSFDSSRDMVCLVTPAVPTEWRSSLAVAGWTVLQVPVLEEFWWGHSDECSNFVADQGERWGHMATKIRLWQLTQYARVLYLDADTVLTSNVDDIFSTVTSFAAEAPKHHTGFNAGVLMLSPSDKVFSELLSLGRQKHASQFGNLIDCTEQGLLNSYFIGDAGRKVTKLHIGRADFKVDWRSDNTPFAVHWITHVCPKPWLVDDQAQHIEAHCDSAVYEYWQRIWSRLASSSSKNEAAERGLGARDATRRKLRRLTGVASGPSLVGHGRPAPKPTSVVEMAANVRESVGRQLRQVVFSRRELRRRRSEYDSAPFGEATWAWIAIIGTLALGLAAGALLHKLFIKAPDSVGKGMTVVQAKRMGFQALGEGKGHHGVVSAVDDEEDDSDEEDVMVKAKGKK